MPKGNGNDAKELAFLQKPKANGNEAKELINLQKPKGNGNGAGILKLSSLRRRSTASGREVVLSSYLLVSFRVV